MANVRLLIAGAAVVFGCGGKVVFVEDDGLGPLGGDTASNGGAPSNGGGPPQVTGGAGDGGSIGVGVPVTECQLACNTVFQCGLQSDGNGLLLCPGLQPGDQTQFVSGCAESCESNMALIAIIDPDDCEGTIETLETVSPDFDDICAFGF